MAIQTIINTLRLARKGHRIIHSPHKHVILGHGLEVLGTGLAVLKLEFVANFCLLGGAAILLVWALIEET
jgi:hypothetical protein